MADQVVKAGFWYFNQSQRNGAPIPFTHLFCAFADISPSTHKISIPATRLTRFRDFARASQVKSTFLSIGGIGSDPSTIALIAGKPTHRQDFIQSSIDQARAYNFDGLDLFWPCWKYPQNTGPTADDMNNLGLLLEEWRQALRQEATNDKKELLLSATVFYKPTIINGPVSASYPADAMEDNLNWINVRAYDLYDPKSTPSLTEPPAALKNPADIQLFRSVDSGISAWTHAVSAKKIVIGLPFVGFEWSLKNPDLHDISAPANGPYGNGDGLIFDRDTINKTDFTHKFNSEYVTHYCYSGYKWIGYDDTDSIKEKIQYAKENQLGGYFAWHVCADDTNWKLSQTASHAWDDPRVQGEDE